MDCDDSLCMDPMKLNKFCAEECTFESDKLIDKKTGKHVKAVLAVHVFGNMADMVSIRNIADRYHLKVIEDATEALGTYYTQGDFIGKYAGTIGDVGVYSFNGNKIITTGGGGMIVSDNEEYLRRAKHLTTQAKSDELHYTHDEIGYNYRMTNLQAAMGIAQLEQLEEFIKIKTENYWLYRQGTDDVNGIKLLPVREGIRSNYWFYALDCAQIGWKRDELIQYLTEHRIQSRPIWGLIHNQKPYKGTRAYQIEKAEHYWSRVVNLPCSTNLGREDVLEVLKSIRKMQIN